MWDGTPKSLRTADLAAPHFRLVSRTTAGFAATAVLHVSVLGAVVVHPRKGRSLLGSLSRMARPTEKLTLRHFLKKARPGAVQVTTGYPEALGRAVDVIKLQALCCSATGAQATEHLL